MPSDVLGYNITLHEESPAFHYLPFRDVDYTQGWNSSYTGNATYTPPFPAAAGEDAGGGGRGSGIAFRRTAYNGSSVTLSFEGITLYLCFTANEASYTFSIDDQLISSTYSVTSGTDCSDYGAETLAVGGDLDYGVHTAILTTYITSTNASFNFFGGVVTISAGVGGSIISELIYIDDSDPRWIWEPTLNSWYNLTWWNPAWNFTFTYNGNWSPNTHVTFYTQPGVAAMYLLTPARFNSYSYTVSLDGADSIYNATNFWTADQQVAFFAGGLDQSQSHTLIITNYDVMSPLGPDSIHGPNLYIDALVLIGSTPPSSTSTTIYSAGASASLNPSPTPNPTAQSRSSSIPAIAGGVVGSVVGILLLISVAFLVALRRRRRRAAFEAVRSPFLVNGHAALSPTVTAVPAGKIAPSLSAVSGGQTGPAELSISRTGPSSGQRTTAMPLRGVATLDLVQVLNERMRIEQADSLDEPPLYQ